MEVSQLGPEDDRQQGKHDGSYKTHVQVEQQGEHPGDQPYQL